MSIRSDLIQGFVAEGWQVGRGGVWFSGDGIISIVSPEISKKNGLFYITSGFSVKSLSKLEPEKFWQCHAYGSAGDIEYRVSEIISNIRQNRHHDKSKAIGYGSETANIIMNYASISAFQTDLLPRICNKWMILKEIKTLL